MLLESSHVWEARCTVHCTAHTLGLAEAARHVLWGGVPYAELMTGAARGPLAAPGPLGSAALHSLGRTTGEELCHPILRDSDSVMLPTLLQSKRAEEVTIQVSTRACLPKGQTSSLAVPSG